LARQRSGTNPLRSVLESHADIFCFNEVFNLRDKDSEQELLRNTNFFTFLENYADGNMGRILPDRHETLFVDFLEYLRCFSSKRYLLLDVKYNTTHFLTVPWTVNMTYPDLFDFIERYEMKVLNLTRKNYLRFVLSAVKSWESNLYSHHDLPPESSDYEDAAMQLDVDYLLGELERCRDEDMLIESRFSGYPHLLTYDYADLFPGFRAGISPGFLAAVSAWLGIQNRFRKVPTFKKQSSLPLSDAIENYAEVEKALRGTVYEYCLDDEPSYRRQAEATARRIRAR
jgi:hypothetical protein